MGNHLYTYLQKSTRKSSKTVLKMVIKFAFLVMIVFLNSATDGKYLLVKLDAEWANKGFEAEQDQGANQEVPTNRCQPKNAPCNDLLRCCAGYCNKSPIAIYGKCV